MDEPTHTTKDDLRVTPRWDDDEIAEPHHAPDTRHLFLAGDETALCGHPATADHPRRRLNNEEYPSDITACCERCTRAVTSTVNSLQYRSPTDAWNKAGKASDQQRITVETESGEIYRGVVTSEADTSSVTGQRFVALDVDPDNDLEGITGQDYRLVAKESHVVIYDIYDDLDDRDEKPVGSVELGEQYDYQAAVGENPDARRSVIEQCEQRAAELYRRAERADPQREAYLELKNAASKLSNVSYLLRQHPDSTLRKIRQRYERTYEHLQEFDTTDRQEAAKVRGKLNGYREVLDTLGAVQRHTTDGSDSSNGTELVTDGGAVRSVESDASPENPLYIRVDGVDRDEIDAEDAREVANDVHLHLKNVLDYEVDGVVPVLNERCDPKLSLATDQ